MTLRVLHVISGIDPENGGPTNALLGLAGAQARLGVDVQVVATWQRTSGRDNAETFRQRDVKVRMIGPASGKLSRHPELAPALERLVADADVVHIHALWEEIQHRAARVCQARGKPYIIRPCGGLHPWSLAQRRLPKRLYLALRLRRNLDRAAALHYTTPAERDAVAPLKLKAQAVVEPNGVDLREFADVSSDEGRRFLDELLARHDIVLGTNRVIIFLGRLHPKKGLDVLVPAFAQAVAGGMSQAILVLAGPEEDAATLAMIREIAARPGMAGRIAYVGMLRSRERVLALSGADLFALTSITENFGIVVVEALAAGLPVILSEGVEVQDQIKDAGVGQVVPLDRAAVAGAIRDWMADPARRASASDRARQFAIEHFDWDQIAQRWQGHYQRLIAGDSAAGRGV